MRVAAVLLSLVAALSGCSGSRVEAADMYFSRENAFPDGPLATLGDFDGDGHLDILVAGPPGVRLLLGVGNGTFAPDDSGAAAHCRPCVAIASADLDADGRRDLVALEEGRLRLFTFIGDGNFTEVFIGEAAGVAGDSLLLVDADADADVDILLGREGAPLLLVENLGGGSLAAPRELARAGRVFTVAQLDGGGALDLATIEGGRLHVYGGLLPGASRPSGSPPVPGNASTVAPIDFDHDGDVDLLVAGTAGVQVMENRGSLEFIERVEMRLGAVTRAAIGIDLDGDSWEDALALDDSGLRVLRNTQGRLEDAGWVDTAGNAGLAVADLDGDRRPDAVVFGRGVANTVLLNAGSAPAPIQLTLLTAAGVPALGAMILVPAGGGSAALVVGGVGGPLLAGDAPVRIAAPLDGTLILQVVWPNGKAEERTLTRGDLAAGNLTLRAGGSA